MINGLLLYFLTFCVIGIFPKFVQAELKKTSNSDEFLNIDYTNLDSQLESLRTSNDFLKLRIGMMQFQLDKQKELWLAMDKKFDQMTLSLQNLTTKISLENKEHLSRLSDISNMQNQLLNSKSSAAVVDDKWEILTDIGEALKTHDHVLLNIERKLNTVEDALNKASWQKQTRELDENFLNSLTVLQNIDKKITNIETAAATKELQLAFNRNMEKYFSRNEETKICLKGEHEKLICTSESYPTSCSSFSDKYCSDNKCRIVNHHFGADPFSVSCDDQSEGGGWTVIQRRINGSVDFYRNWSEYKSGFGDISGEFFIGLDKLNALTTTLKPVELLIQLQDFNDTKKYAKYDEFHVGPETENYNLTKVGKYSGNAGDCFIDHQGFAFTTKDRDNDGSARTNCASYLEGAWWYHKCSHCNLNGMYRTTKLEQDKFGIFWCLFHGDKFSLKSVQMSIRPKRI